MTLSPTFPVKSASATERSFISSFHSSAEWKMRKESKVSFDSMSSWCPKNHGETCGGMGKSAWHPGRITSSRPLPQSVWSHLLDPEGWWVWKMSGMREGEMSKSRRKCAPNDSVPDFASGYWQGSRGWKVMQIVKNWISFAPCPVFIQFELETQHATRREIWERCVWTDSMLIFGARERKRMEDFDEKEVGKRRLSCISSLFLDICK